MRKIIVLYAFLIAAVIVLSAGPASATESAKTRITINDVSLEGSEVIAVNGVTLVSFRALLDAFGGKIGNDGETGAVTGRLNGKTIRIRADEALFEYEDQVYDFPIPVKAVKGRLYVPVRALGAALGYHLSYDSSNRAFRLTKYGLGQDGYVRELLEAYYRGTRQPLSDLVTLDNPDRIYLEASSSRKKIPNRSFEFWMGDIVYLSDKGAVVTAGFRSETQAVSSSVERRFFLRREQGQWKIANAEWVHFTQDLPKDADESAKQQLATRQTETQQVVRDLETYYKAMNEENLEQAMKSLSPYFVEEWEKATITDETYGSFLQELFEGDYSDRVEKLLDARVLYLDDSIAAVHARILYSEENNNPNLKESERSYTQEYELLVEMDLTPEGRWTFYRDWDLNGDY
ncbi:copper amine oxidase N-terminal domain-containing protein [Cohnella cholangitidis]|uniref:Copper amine oxidase N-terminal domain-containing protein n=1 Tax=Cohnella cholangitidis TaxID=2598458 RepID=A0A7G5C0M6_9BACL|nr:copper amine oxidase N-terminal domain-containing protein [Cohnella cholangitidis]QMV42760.1 copper amine oxidase N-terminal domain-containing protein [Cohnella cholangitidis]